MQSNWVIKIMPRWEKRHARPIAVFRIAVGIWLLVLTAILVGYDRAGWWPALLVPAAIAHFYWAYLLLRLADDGHLPGAAA